MDEAALWMVFQSGGVPKIGLKYCVWCVSRLQTWYLDDILLVARRSQVKQGAHCVAQKLRRA